jgi:hypothetical protein
MRPEDLPDVMALGAAIHLHHPERPAVFAERLALAPTGCFVLGRPVLGYALSHPWRLTGPPPLDSLLGSLPKRPEAWHLHDIALAPNARGAGHGAGGLRCVLSAAALAGFCQASLVAIEGQAARWARLGFQAAPCAAPAALASYGAKATWMTKAL